MSLSYRTLRGMCEMCDARTYRDLRANQYPAWLHVLGAPSIHTLVVSRIFYALPSRCARAELPTSNRNSCCSACARIPHVPSAIPLTLAQRETDLEIGDDNSARNPAPAA
jgi:hypothetical protein